MASAEQINDAAAAMLRDRTPAELAKLLRGDGRLMLRHLREGYLSSPPPSLSPGSAEANEAATRDAETWEAAARRWRRLSPDQRTTLRTVVQRLGSEPDELERSLELHAAIPPTATT